MARRYNVEGTKSYLIGAIFCLGIGLWHLVDGWFPRADVLEDHPKTIEIRSLVDAEVAEIPVVNGQEVTAGAILIKLTPTEPGAEPVILHMQDGMSKKSKVTHGIIEEIAVGKGDRITPSTLLFRLKSTRDSYYTYNKTTAVIMLIIAFVCALIHKAVR